MIFAKLNCFCYFMSRTDIKPKPIPNSCVLLNLSLKYSFETAMLKTIEKIDTSGNKIVAFIFAERYSVKKL